MIRASTSSMSSSASALGPPLYWKVPGSDRHDRDYITENMKHVRQVSSETRKVKSKERLEPMKVKFIPGLTKNPHYQHVESRISGLIKGTMKVLPREPIKATHLSTSVYSKEIDDSKPIWGASTAANARRIKIASDIQKPGGSTIPVFRRRPATLKPQLESVYNWRFSDTNDFSPTFTEQERLSNPDKFAQFRDTKDIHLHRVEYLPCDGICADEPVFSRDEHGSGDGGSGRSSRGINTEETRIFANNFAQLRASQSLSRLDNQIEIPVPFTGPEGRTKTVQHGTDNLNQHQHLLQRQRHNSHEYPGHLGCSVKETSTTTDPFVERIKQNMAGMQLNGSTSRSQRQGCDSQVQGDFMNRNATESGSSCSRTSPRRNGFPDSPHKTGAIPTYLKKRQQQWKQEAIAQQEAEKAANIPPGHVAMSEAERVESLAKLQSTYDNLVNELNRVPIRIDTIRVREYKQHLEQELVKLEQAMRLFSRPTLYIKVDP